MRKLSNTKHTLISGILLVFLVAAAFFIMTQEVAVTVADPNGGGGDPKSFQPEPVQITSSAVEISNLQSTLITTVTPC